MRMVRGLASFAALVAVLVGAPLGLTAWGRLGRLATVDWSHLLTVRDDGTLLLGVLTIVGWLVWAVLAASIVVELIDVARRMTAGPGLTVPAITVPGLDLPRSLVRGLVVALVGAVISSGPALGHHLSTPQIAPTAAVAAGTVGVERPVEAAPRASASPPAGPAPTPSAHPRALQHVTQQGDDLWNLAVSYYGDGTRWRQIAAANPGLAHPDGGLDPGARLIVPVGSATGDLVVVVKAGDTLWALARRHLGDPSRWPEIFEANRDLIDDPDEIDVGWRLVIPTDAPTSPAASMPPVTPAQPGDGLSAPSLDSAPDSTPGPDDATSATRDSPDATPTTPATAPTTAPTTPPSTDETPMPVPAEAPEAPGSGVSDSRSGDTSEPDPDDRTDVPLAPALALVGGVGVVLAGGLVAQLRRRRTVQLALRPVGRRILHPDDAATRVATALGQVAARRIPDVVDAVTRSLGPARLTARGAIVLAGDDELTIIDPGGGEQRFTADGVAALLTPGPGDPEDLPPCPTPALIAVGTDGDGRQLLVDVEAAGLLSVDLDDPLPLCVAIGLELACSPWSDGVQVVAAGMVGQALSAELENVDRPVDAGRAAAEAMARIRSQRAVLERRGQTLADVRGDDDLRDAWSPRVYLFGPDLGSHTASQLRDLLLAGPPIAVGVVLAGGQAVPARASAVDSIVAGSPRRAADDPASGLRVVPTDDGALLEPSGYAFRPQELPSATAAVVAELLAVTASDETTPAPWFMQADLGSGADHPPLTSPSGPGKETVAVGPTTSPGVTDFSHPTLLLLGPIELLGASGPPPPRAERSCIEYCAWLLEHPGATATAMANSLLVAEGTRRSNVSRLRTWLGMSDDGRQYLPDAYSGRLNLDACVSSDWHRLKLLITKGVPNVSRDTLVSALRLVRGAPLADAAPGQWHWAEELRTDMSSTIRDIGVIVAEGAVADGDIDLARWATARALTAAPEDELLLCCRIKAEHRAGNRAEVERLVLRLTRHARVLGIDLADETVQLIQEVIEGRPRARA